MEEKVMDIGDFLTTINDIKYEAFDNVLDICDDANLSERALIEYFMAHFSQCFDELVYEKFGINKLFEEKLTDLN